MTNEQNRSGDRYNVVRFCSNDEHPDHRRIIAHGLTLAQARAHCRDEHSWRDDRPWFDGYERAR